jgi:hypothetical protein
MKQFRTFTISVGLAASIAAAGCSSSTDSGAGGGHGSATGSIDGGDVGAGSAAGTDGGPVLGGGGAFGQGGASGGASAPGSRGGAGSTGGATSTSPGGASPGGPITGVTPVGTEKVCSAQSANASAGILDVFVMLDRSESMTQASAGGTKWEVITDSLDSFLKAPESASISAGISFFGITSGTGGKGGCNSSCTATDYAKPVVPIATLGGASGNAAKIATAIQQTSPGSNTPTEPALQGAVDYASSWAKQHPTHKVIVVFATDGLPNGCNSTVDGAAKIAAAGAAANPSIKTYVIGVFGDKDCPGGVTQGQSCTVVSNTNAIAKGGGTGSAFIVNASAGTGEQFLLALNAIRAANQVGCDFKVTPPAKGTAIDFTRATVRYTPGSGAAVVVPWKASVAQCGATAGWYYNSNTAPNELMLCGASCKTVTADLAAKIDVSLACQPPGTTGAGGAGNGGGGTTGSGSGGASTASGGSGSGAGGAVGAGGATSCLLSGQSCQTDGECCGGLCAAGVCTSIIR